MTKRKSDKSALAVLKRITHQESLLAQAALFESMHKLRHAEDRQAQLATRQDQHHQQIASIWRALDTHALMTVQTTMPYRNWLKAEIVGASTVVKNLNVEAEAAKDHEKKLRAEGRLLDELVSRRDIRDAKALELLGFKETDELVLMRARKPLS
jgi:hypothetical protein